MRSQGVIIRKGWRDVVGSADETVARLNRTTEILDGVTATFHEFHIKTLSLSHATSLLLLQGATLSSIFDGSSTFCHVGIADIAGPFIVLSFKLSDFFRVPNTASKVVLVRLLDVSDPEVSSDQLLHALWRSVVNQ